MQKVHDPLKKIVVKYPKQYKVINGGREFHRLMVAALKQKVMDRMFKPKGKEAQKQADPVTQ